MRPDLPRTLQSFLLGAIPLLLLLGWSAPSRALGEGGYSIQVLLDGVPLEEYAARGRTYVEARQGREYSIRVRNHTAERVAVALSIDGLNSIDARTTGTAAASKWVIGPYSSIVVDGWQTGARTARRFYFTNEQDSYGEWLGKTRNLGLISAAVFREIRPQPAPVWRPDAPARPPSGPYGRLGDDAAGERRQEGAAAPQTESSEKRARPKAAAVEELAATGIGRELDHPVNRVRFDSRAKPSAEFDVRYEFRDELVRLGVLPDRLALRDERLRRREAARGFSDSGFAPDPFRP